jgi:small subunit ribosomal protein S13
LRKIFGIGTKKSTKICLTLGISKKTPVKFLTTELRNRIILYIENNEVIGDDLKQNLNQIKEKQIRLRTYKGQRAKFKLPRRGQRTRTNAKTAKKMN